MALIFWVSCGALNANAEELRTLFVGNSFTFYSAPNDIPGGYQAMVDEHRATSDSVLIEAVALGGYTLEMHLEDADGSNGDTPLRSWLLPADGSTNPWDLVVLQEQSQIGGFYGRNDNDWQQIYWGESLSAVQALDAMISSRGALTAMLMTWGYRDGDNAGQGRRNNSHIFPDFKVMQAKLSAGYEAYVQALSGPSRQAYIIPAGLAFERVYDDVLLSGGRAEGNLNDFTALYSPDGRHPSVRGSYLASCVTYAALTGRDPQLMRWAPDEIEDTEAEYLRKIAAQVVFEDALVPRTFPWGSSPRYPFIARWQAQVDDGEKDVLLTSSLHRPLWLIEGVVPPIVTLQVGGSVGGDGIGAGWLDLNAEARLLVSERLNLAGNGHGKITQRGGSLQTPELIIAEAPDAIGELTIQGGTAQIDSIIAGAGDARIDVEGGTLTATDIDAALTITGGRWEVNSGGSITGPLVVGANAQLILSLGVEEGASLTASDAVSLEGPVVIRATETLSNGDYTLLVAPTLDPEGIQVDSSGLEEMDVEWRVDETSPMALILTLSGIPEVVDTPPEPVEPALNQDDERHRDASPGALGDDAGSDQSTSATDTTTQGCAGSTPHLPSLGLLCCWLFWRYRQRVLRVAREI